MSPNERRTALIRLLAEIDQQTSREEDRAFQPNLSREERELAVVKWEFRRRAAEQVERMLLQESVVNDH
jgi:hypothetical protein